MDGETVLDSSPAYTPYRGRIDRSPLIEPWLVKIEFTHTLWGKIYRGDICRKAAEQMKDTPFGCTLEDYYIFFLITYFSKSYVGVPDESLYIYRRGIGINRNVLLTLRSVRLLPAFEEFLTARNALAENEYLLKYVAERLYDCSLSILLKTEKLAPEMFKEAARCWGAQILLDFIANIGVFNVRVKDWRQIMTRLVRTVLQQHPASEK